MNAQQILDAIRVSTNKAKVLTQGNTQWDSSHPIKTITYIDADAFLAAVERFAEAEKRNRVAYNFHGYPENTPGMGY